MHLYKTVRGAVLVNAGSYYHFDEDWDTFINQKNLYHHLIVLCKSKEESGEAESKELIAGNVLPPVGSQEIWAAGVTYLRSRDARMEEAENAGGADFYQKVYEAERPELFFKALPHRVAGEGQ